MSFRGHYEHSLDAKNRLSVPARFRATLSSGLVLSKASDACISVSTPEAHESMLDRALEGKNPLGSEYRAVQRYFQGNSFDAELDASGRVTLPGRLLEHAGIEKEAVVAGVGDHLEIWDRKRWDDEQAALDASIGEVTEGLGNPS
jgi:MraZ protein